MCQKPDREGGQQEQTLLIHEIWRRTVVLKQKKIALNVVLPHGRASDTLVRPVTILPQRGKARSFLMLRGWGSLWILRPWLTP
jgi:hypothetical protein